MATTTPKIPSAAQYKKAFLAIQVKMHPKHFEMLEANYAAPKHTISVENLAKAVGYKTAQQVYGYLGRLLCDQLRFRPTMTENGKPVLTQVLADKPPKRSGDSWEWKLRPQVVQALKDLGWVKQSASGRKANPSMTVWRMAMKFGSGGFNLWPQCREKGVAAITYSVFDGVDLRMHSKTEPAKLWSQLTPTPKASLRRLAFEMKKGDVIYVKDGKNIVGRGIVTGGYRFDRNCDIIAPKHADQPFAHQVPVKWDEGFPTVPIQLGAEQTTILALNDHRLRQLEKAVRVVRRGKPTTTTAQLVVTLGNRNDKFRQYARTGQVIGWSATQQFKTGDLAFFYFGAPFQEITAVGQVASPPEVRKGKFPWTPRRKVSFCDFSPVWTLSAPVVLSEIAEKNRTLAKWLGDRPYRNSRSVPSDVSDALVEAILFHNPDLAKNLTPFLDGQPSNAHGRRTPISFPEGGVYEIITELFVRDRRLRELAIKEKGLVCQVCGFSFGDFYGQIGADFIEVHHLRPLSSGNGRARTTTVDGVAVVCSNCHRMLHHNGRKPLRIDELKKMVVMRAKRNNGR